MRCIVSVCFFVLLAAPGFPNAAPAAPDYASAREALREAMASNDHEAALRHARAALAFRPGAPWLLGALAGIQARLGQTESALGTLTKLTDLSVRFDPRAERYEALRGLDGFSRLIERQRALDAPVGDYRVAARLDEPAFIPEGIAVDGDGRFYLGSIRHGKIVRIDDGDAATLVPAGENGLAGVFGMRAVENTGVLWAATAVVPQAAEADAERAGRSGILRFRLETGEPVDAHWLPDDGREHVLGDLIVTGDHTAVTTDSLTGAVLTLDTRSGEFTTLIDPGRLTSPQGIVLDRERGVYFIADWSGGLFRYAPESGALARVSASPGVMLYGIDGLYLHGGDLVAVQNLARPHRVTRIQLDGPGHRAVAQHVVARALPEFDEPTLGAIHRGTLYLNANSHWNRFDGDHRLPDGLSLSPPAILALPLAP